MKKTILITLLALLGMTQAVAQEYEYVPFVREGVKWVYFYIYKPGYYVPGPELKVYLTLEFKGDTVINGKTYKAMHKYFGESINESNDTVPVYMREENKVVYGIVPNGKTYSDCPIGIGGTYEIFDQVMHGEEFILYDFNDPAAYFTEMLGYNYEDEEDTLYYSVTSVDTIKAGNRLVRKFNIGYNDSSRSLFAIVEGIGFDSMTRYGSMTPGLIGYTLFPIWKMPIGGETRYFAMSHVIENGEIVYKASDYEEPQPDPDEYEYVPFVREGVKWVYNISDYHYYHLSDNPANGDNLYYRTLEFRGDTIINGKTYKAMHRCVDDELSEPSDVIPIYMREEDKRVYGIVPDGKFYDDAIISNTPIFGPSDVIYSGKEFLLYDFQEPMNVIINDWYGYNLKMDTIEVGGHLAKRYFYGAGAGDDFQIIEGIGATGMNSYPLAFLMPIGTGIHTTEYYWLEHVIEDGEVVYGSVRDRYMPLILEDVKWVFERVTVNDGDTTCSYYTYEFKGNDPVKDNYGYTYKALYCYDGIHHELDVENDSIVAGLREDWGNIRYYRNEPLSQVISQGRDMIDFNQKYLYYLLSEGNSWEWGKSLYIQYQKEPFLNDENFVEADPIMIGRYRCKRLAYIGEQGDTLAYIVQGIGFDSRDLGDLLTPFTRKPGPDAEHQEWCGLSHVIKNGEIIYKGMRYREGATDGIDEVVTDKTRRPLDPNYYNLMGQPVGKDVPTVPGIYIHQGKKIVVR